MDTSFIDNFRPFLFNDYAEIDDILLWMRQVYSLKLRIMVEFRGESVRYITFENGDRMNIGPLTPDDPNKTTWTSKITFMPAHGKVTEVQIRSRDELFDLLTSLCRAPSDLKQKLKNEPDQE